MCEFQLKERADRHYTGTGPRTGEWEDQYPYRTWEINWPDPVRPAFPEDLLGIMDFEVDWLYEICENMPH